MRFYFLYQTFMYLTSKLNVRKFWVVASTNTMSMIVGRVNLNQENQGGNVPPVVKT